jgi:phosphoribosyl-AMP cyclohydrolase
MLHGALSATSNLQSDSRMTVAQTHSSHSFFSPTALNFSKMGGLVPFVLQHAYSRDILMVGFLNEEAWKITCETSVLTMFRRGLGRIWQLGEEEGHLVNVSRVRVDCDEDTVIFETTTERPICGHGYRSCFYHEIPDKKYAHAD